MTVTPQKQRWHLLLTIIVLATAAALLPTLHTAPPAALAQEPTTDASTPEGCYNGVLTTEIGHCYLFETAEREGRIKIESIYLEPTRALHVFLSRPDPIDEKLAKYFETTAHQRMEKNTREFHGDTDGSRTANLNDWIDYQNTCKGLTGDEKRYCYNTILGRGSSHGLFWHPHHSKIYGFFPDTRGEHYTNVFMHTGGAEAKKTIPGWASWRQLWPNKEDEKPTGVPEFDVSGIDIDNIPEPVCREAVFELSGFPSPHLSRMGSPPRPGGRSFASQRRGQAWRHIVFSHHLPNPDRPGRTGSPEAAAHRISLSRTWPKNRNHPREIRLRPTVEMEKHT